MQRSPRLVAAAALAGAALVALPATAPAKTKVVDMGVPVKAQKQFGEKLQADVNDFFPHGITVRKGDKVRFMPVGFHTVDFPARGDDPLGLTGAAGPVSGAADAAGAPFWFNGQPALGFNPALVQMGFGKAFTYTGRKRVQSGLPLAAKPKPMTVKFAKTGSFTYFCTLHPGMKGTVKVVGKHRKVPSRKADARTVARQVKRDLKIAKGLADASVPANTVDIGVAGEHGVEYFDFAPANLDVAPGTTVTFRMSPGTYEDHTATAGPGDPEAQPDSYLGKLAASFLQGPLFDPAAAYPSDPPGTVASLSPTTHGNGFWNSGVLDGSSATPLPGSRAVRFDKPGTYTFYCLIHPFMKGTVTVG